MFIPLQSTIQRETNRIQDASKRYPNIKVIKAYMPEMFGTHHTKAMVLFRYDDLAQVVILTANFIERDFKMSQAIWRTPLLPLQKRGLSSNDTAPPLGSGLRFKHDLLAYFRGYSRNRTATLADLVSQLQDYDFSAVRAALIGSLPGLQMLGQFKPEEQDRIGRWGLPALKRILSSIPANSRSSANEPNPQPHIVAQVSSIASVGEKWLLTSLVPTLSTIQPPIKSLQKPSPKPKISIIFPTADSIRKSVDGYGSGGSIHMKTTSTAQAKQLAVLKPILCHWSGGSKPQTYTSTDEVPIGQAGRGRAAPHIKTYIRFSDASMKSIDWAMMTSANLSTQAWGSSPNAGGEVKICSYELGVVIWPGLWDDAAQGSTSASMVPVFGGDMPTQKDSKADDDDDELGRKGVTVGWRMPYDLPLVPYGENEKPWCATEPCDEPDWMGRVWPGYGR